MLAQTVLCNDFNLFILEQVLEKVTNSHVIVKILLARFEINQQVNVAAI
jgi:hypothetical protein